MRRIVIKPQSQPATQPGSHSHIANQPPSNIANQPTNTIIYIANHIRLANHIATQPHSANYIHNQNQSVSQPAAKPYRQIYSQSASTNPPSHPCPITRPHKYPSQYCPIPPNLIINQPLYLYNHITKEFPNQPIKPQSQPAC